MQTAAEIASPQVHTSQPSGTDRCFILSGVSWETYERLLADMQDSHAAHFAYDRGVLEIMAPSYEQESIKEIIALLVNVLAEELDIDIQGGGSTTFLRKDLARGFEPDECFYIQHAELVRGKRQSFLDPAREDVDVLLWQPAIGRHLQIALVVNRP